jgi:DNA-binding transcriptional LysR family regulator
MDGRASSQRVRRGRVATQLPAGLAELVRHHPEVQLHVTMMNSERVIDALLRGRVDVCFVEGLEHSGNVELRRLRDDELVLIAPRGHRFGALESVSLSDVQTEPFVLREEGSGTREVAEAYLRSAGVAPETLRVTAVLSAIDAIKAAVAAGLGVSIISRSALSSEADGDRLIQRPIAGVRLIRELAAAFVVGVPPLPAARALVEHLERQAH